MKIYDLQTFQLIDVNHPGATDPAYRARRVEISDEANRFWESVARGKSGEENFLGSGDLHTNIKNIEYKKTEVNTWKEVNMKLDDMLPSRACSDYLKARKILDLPLGTIPQMRDISSALSRIKDFRLFPVAGLVESRAFLSFLGHRAMLCTQYIRHHSRPTFTPEPDLIHEYIGHAPMFTNQEVVDFSVRIGELAQQATNEQIQQLERLYWFTVEYGLIEEQGRIKAFGAGVLAGIEDQNNAFKSGADVRPFHLQEILNTPYDYASLQPRFYVLSSFQQLRDAIEQIVR